MTVLIISQADDIHASAVSWALHHYGVDSRLVCAADFPELVEISFRPGTEASVRITEPESGDPIDSPNIEVVWFRRFTGPTVPDDAHPADRFAIQHQGFNFQRSLLASSFKGAFWINDHDAHLRGSNKLHQLNVAIAEGLRVPATLVSNRPGDIQAFIDSAEGQIVAKPLSPLNWHGPTHVAAAYTTVVSVDDCQDANALRWLPMIYQERVEKAFELRVVVMGRTIFAAKILSQSIPEAVLDWRAAQQSPDLCYEMFELPSDVTEQIFRFMDRVGLVFGALDLIVDPIGNFWFLEVNEQGQFLFLEERLPQIPLLDAFAQFCRAASPAFVYIPTGTPVRFGDFLISDSWTVEGPRKRKLHKAYIPRFSEEE